MSSTLRATVSALALVLLAACATAGTGGVRSSTRWDRLTREQLLETHYSTLYDVVLSLRANWLSTRGPDSIQGQPSQVVVYLDDQRLGGVEHLQSIPIAGVGLVRHFTGPEAAARWGLGHGAGVIYVSTQVGNP